jgi:hypothetical protein
MNARFEDWLDQMRQARDPGPIVRVLIVRSGRAESWTFDVTEKTDLEDLAERMDATIRDANCRKCELRAVDGDGRVIDNLIHRADQTALAQVVGPVGVSVPFEVTESISAALRTHRSFTVLGLKGIAENQQHTKDIIAELRAQNTALVQALGDARRERSEEVAGVRAESGAEIAALRKENAALRERVNKQWEMEDQVRSKYVEQLEDLEKTRIYGRAAMALIPAAVAHFLPNSRGMQQNMRQQLAEQFLDSITKEQTEAVMPLLRQDQLAILASFMKLQAQGEEPEQAVSEPLDPITAAAAEAAKANSEIAAGTMRANGRSKKE